MDVLGDIVRFDPRCEQEAADSSNLLEHTRFSQLLRTPHTGTVILVSKETYPEDGKVIVRDNGSDCLRVTRLVEGSYNLLSAIG
jgi:hypothetical protein